VTLAFYKKKNLGLVLALKSGLKMPLGLSYPLQTILLSGKVGRLVHFFKNLKRPKQPLLSAAGYQT
jgi:hypothetical protein